MNAPAELNIRFPEKAQFLFEPARYKVAYGGRGSGKSWSFARALILMAANGGERILCTREIQKSIKDSVHRLLSDQIAAMGLGHLFEIQETTIKGPGGSEFLFAGLANHTVESIKSYEGVTICWIEEAQTVSKRSLDILIPTIRADGSEIWVTFNPELDTDEAWARFVASPPPGAVVRQMLWSDNPWFPAVLEQERQHCKIISPDDYDTIWEGKCRSAVIGAIYSREIAEAVAGQRIRDVPYDPKLLAHAVWDLGWNDSMSIAIVQRGPMGDIRVIDYIEDDHKTLDWYAAKLKAMPLNWGYDWLPHDGNTKDFKTGKSAAEILRGFGRKVKTTPNIGIENGIKAARQTFAQAYFDRVKAARLVECLKRYRRSINVATQEAGSPVHDEYSHGADVWRYIGVNSDLFRNEVERNDIAAPAYAPLDPVMGY